jgi:hypothetical protein
VNKTRLAIFAGVLIILALASIPVSNPTALVPLFSDTLSVCPDSTWKTEGEIFDLGVCVSAGITNLMGYNVAVTFDSSVIEIMNVVEGPLPKSAPSSFFKWDDAGVKSDSVVVTGAILGTTVAGPGELFTLTFKARHHGVVNTTDICIRHSALRDGANQPIGHERRCGFVEVETTTGVEPPRPDDIRLECYPNPFNPSITLVLSLPESGTGFSGTAVTIGVYTPDGRLVRTLFSGDVNPGERRFVWDGKNAAGEEASSGVYFAVAKTEAGTLKTKLVLVR